MPALTGQVITTLPDPNGGSVTATWFYDPTTLNLRNNPSTWTDPSGLAWLLGSGAFIGVNSTSRDCTMIVWNADGVTPLREIAVPVGNTSLSLLALGLRLPPFGPFTSVLDFNGMTFNF